MAVSETARLIASLELKDLFTKQVDNATKSLGKLDKGLDGSQSRAYKAGAQIGTGIKRGTAIAIGAVGFLATNVALGVHSLEGLEQATTQTNAVLKSTKGIAGETSDSIREMATRFEGLNATIDDTVIQSGANLLLTFTNIRKKAFEPALLAALNLSTALHQDLQQSALQVGKALNDPIKGITALRRAGVSFTADQIKQIKALVKTNDLYGAQKIILGELDREFKGSFAAQGQTTAGKFEKVRDAVDDLQRSLATALLPALGKISDSLSKFLTSPEVTRGIANLGKDIAGLFSDQNLAAGADFLKSAISTAMTAAPIIEAAAKATLGFVQAAVGIFKQLPAPLQGLLVGGFALNKLTGGLVTNIAGGILGAVKGIRGQSPAVPLYVSDVGIGGGLAGTAGKGGGLLGTLTNLTIAGGIIAAAVPIGQAFAAALPDALKGPGGQGQSEAQQARIRADAAMAKAATVLTATLTADKRQPGAILDRGGREKGFTELAGKIKDDRLSVVQLYHGITAEFQGNLRQLYFAVSNPKELKAAVEGVRKILITNGRGGVEQTRATIKALQYDLRKLKTHDPELAKTIRATIHDLQGKLPNRIYAAQAVDRANKIIASTKSTAAKIHELQGIERDLKDRKLPGQTRALQAKIAALQAAQVRAANATTQSVKDKDLSVKVDVKSPTVIINSRQVAASGRHVSAVWRQAS